MAIVILFWLKWAGYLAVAGLNLLAQLSDKPFWCLKMFAWSHAKCVSLLALGFTHQKGLSYQIFELEDSGLPQQGILPISATKTTTKANHRFLGKDFFPL